MRDDFDFPRRQRKQGSSCLGLLFKMMLVFGVIAIVCLSCVLQILNMPVTSHTAQPPVAPVVAKPKAPEPVLSGQAIQDAEDADAIVEFTLIIDDPRINDAERSRQVQEWGKRNPRLIANMQENLRNAARYERTHPR